MSVAPLPTGRSHVDGRLGRPERQPRNGHDVYRGVYDGATDGPQPPGSVYARPPLGWAERLMYTKQEENSGRTCGL